jgi:hypothetical protein
MSKKRFRAEKLVQASLFHPSKQTPLWDALPVETRTQVTRLIAQMLKQHRSREQPGDGEACDE